ncbi:hypothetical protein TMU01_18960 [Tenuibacillus multivorans]|nr:hypothetical protein TMU01_18960 [Tenuibacillus multivorans]
MKINFNSIFWLLPGILIGFTIASVIRGFWIDDFDRGQWLSWIIGGIIGYLIMILLLFLMNKRKGN